MEENGLWKKDGKGRRQIRDNKKRNWSDIIRKRRKR